MRAGALSNRTIRLFAYLRRPVKPRVREGVGPGRTMAVRAGSRCVSGQGQDCRTAGRHHAVARIREGAGAGATLWKTDRRFEPVSGEGRGRGAQWRRGLGQDACQGRGGIAVQPEGTTRLPVSGKGPGEGRPCGSWIVVSSLRQGRAGPGGTMAARAGAICVSGETFAIE